jgi:hypothetical protein
MLGERHIRELGGRFFEPFILRFRKSEKRQVRRLFERSRIPERRAPVESHRPESIGGSETLDGMHWHLSPRLELFDRPIGTPRDRAIRCLAMQPVDLAKAKAKGERSKPLPFRGGVGVGAK